MKYLLTIFEYIVTIIVASILTPIFKVNTETLLLYMLLMRVIFIENKDI